MRISEPRYLCLFAWVAVASPQVADAQSVLTRSEILQRIRDEVAYYELSAYYYRGVLSHASMDSEHLNSVKNRDPALSDPEKSVLPNNQCNVSWFDFDVNSAEVVLVNTGDTTTKGSLGLKLPLPGLAKTPISPSISGSVETTSQSSDDLTMVFTASPADVEKRLHPPNGSTNNPALPQDVYPDALRCSSLRYHQWLRVNTISGTSDAAAKQKAQEAFDNIQPEIKSCEIVQIHSVSAAQTSGAGPITARLSQELKTGLRQSPVTPLADHLLSWRQNLIQFARTSPICLPPQAKAAGAFPLSITVGFEVQTDLDPSLGIKLLVVSLSANHETKSTANNSVTFYLSPVIPYTAPPTAKKSP